MRRILVTAVLSGAMLTMVPIGASAQQSDMNEALGHLKEGRESLSHASANKGGHKEKALSLIDQAIEEIKAGKEYARTHPDEKKHL